MEQVQEFLNPGFLTPQGPFFSRRPCGRTWSPHIMQLVIRVERLSMTRVDTVGQCADACRRRADCADAPKKTVVTTGVLHGNLDPQPSHAADWPRAPRW